jgi:hypothetical protein
VGSIIIRNDDVNPNTDYKMLMAIYDIIDEFVPNAEIWSVWSPACFNMPNQNILYPVSYYPLRNQPAETLLKMVTHIGLPLEGVRYHKICSHGLYHISHKNMPRDWQVASIVGSCNMLRTKTFVAPFSEWDETTEEVCRTHNISLVHNGWKSLESEPFDPNHGRWFFHSWRFNPETFRALFNKTATVSTGTVSYAKI